jgi:CheY-like chemotaxis protein
MSDVHHGLSRTDRRLTMPHPITADSTSQNTDRRQARYFGRVLLVSACDADRDFHADYLRRQGFCAIESRTTSEAYTFASSMPLSAIVTEVSMPGDEDGVSLTRRLKQDACLRRLPVVVLTGFVFGSVREACTSAGCDLFLVKPCPPNVLSRAIETLIVRRARELRHLAHAQGSGNIRREQGPQSRFPRPVSFQSIGRNEPTALSVS